MSYVHRCDLYPAVEKSETASAVVIFEGQALLVHNTKEVRDPKRGKGGGTKPDNWGVPGGGIKPGETPEQAVLRELRQELGIAAAAGSETQIFFRHSFMFNENAEGRKPAYEKCQNVVEALRMGRVDEREMRHQSLNWAYFVRCEPTETLLGYFEGRRWERILGAEPTPEEKEYGALVVRLDNKRAEELGIVEGIEGPGGRREIDAIGLFPFEAVEFIRENGVPGFSRSHMGYITAAMRLAEAV